jgi:penicillin-binding protein 1A
MTTGVDRNLYRQRNILGQMKEQGFITEEEYEEAMAQEIVFKSGIAPEDKWEICDNAACGYEGIVGSYTKSEVGSYYCPVCGTLTEIGNDASQEVYSWFVDTVLEDVARDMAALNGIDYDSLDRLSKQLYNQKIQQGGYHIYSTMDMDVQKQIDQIYTNLNEIPTASSRYGQQLQSGIVVIDNRTGDIVGLSGGVGEKIDHDGFNRAIDAKLQTGSAQKPVSVYAPAFESGAVSPATPIKDMPITYEGGNFPKNDNRRYNLWRNVYNGIVNSDS